MKPKIFIGSSVEGLQVAYAVQQNLTHDAEATVWDQGVFQLSKTTIESLDASLESMDFGIFVFSNDDIIMMRGDTFSSVRDNVLFELGLFIGKLGRERVFFIIPNSTSMHIATDLLGITPGTYDPNREDGSLQAGTGAVCSQIRTQIKKLGLINPLDESKDANDPKEKEKEKEKEYDFINDFFDNHFDIAKEKLTKIISGKSGEELLHFQTWLSHINFKLNEKTGLAELNTLSKENITNQLVQARICRIFLQEGYIKNAIKIGEKALEKIEEKNEIITILADCHIENGDLDKAMDILKKYSPEDNPRIAIKLANMSEDKNEALSILNTTYKNYPNHEALVYSYAQLLYDNQKYVESLYLFDFLTKKDHTNTSYWGYLGNICLELDLYNQSMVVYKKADKLSKEKASWLRLNIGNLLSNRGFYSEGIDWLKKGLQIDEESQYGHNRLSEAIKNKESENKKFLEQCKKGHKLLRDFNVPIQDTI